MVAAVLNLNIGAVAAKAVDQVASGFADRHDVIDLHFFGDANQVRHGNPGPGRRLHLFVVADDSGHLGHLGKGFRLGLGGAAGDDDRGTGIFAVQTADFLLGFAHSLGRDGAGVDDHSILQTGGGGHFPHRLGFISVQAAAQCGKDGGVHAV